MKYFVVGTIGVGKSTFIEKKDYIYKIYEPISEYSSYLEDLYLNNINNKEIQDKLTEISINFINSELKKCTNSDKDIYIESIPEIKDIIFRFAYGEYDLDILNQRLKDFIKDNSDEYNLNNIIFIGLDLSTNEIKKQIKIRNRPNEKNISDDTLFNLQLGFMIFKYLLHKKLI